MLINKVYGVDSDFRYDSFGGLCVRRRLCCVGFEFTLREFIDVGVFCVFCGLLVGGLIHGRLMFAI